MLRYIWDKVKGILLPALLLLAVGGGCGVMFLRAGEFLAAAVALFTLGVGVMLICMMIWRAVRDMLRWRRDFAAAESLDEYRDAQDVGHGLRIGPTHLFCVQGALAYGDIRSMYGKMEYMPHLNGETTKHHSLYVVRQNGKKLCIAVINDRDEDTQAQAMELYRQVMDVVAQKNPKAEMHGFF